MRPSDDDGRTEWLRGRSVWKTASEVFGVRLGNVGFAQIRLVDGVHIWGYHRFFDSAGTIVAGERKARVRATGD